MLYKERENIILFKIYVYTMVKTWKGRRSLSEGFEESRFKKLKPYNNQTSIEMDIGNNCRVYAQRYGKTGDWNVRIRFYDTSPTGKLFPSKKGISMPLDSDQALQKLEEAEEDQREEIIDENEEPLYVRV